MFPNILHHLRSRLHSIALRLHLVHRTRRFFAWMFTPKALFWRIPLVGIALFLVISVVARAIPDVMPEERGDPLREVKLLSIVEDSGNIESLLLIGEVAALQKADLRAEAGGQVVSVTKKIGDRVSAGDVIAQFENARERGAALQAEGAVESAQAGLDRTLKGSRSETLNILAAGEENAENSLQTTKESIVNELRSIYIGNEDAIHAKIDSLFTNPRTNSVHFLIGTSDSRLEEDLENSRLSIEMILSLERSRQTLLNSFSDLVAELNTAQEETRNILVFIDSVLRAVNQAIPSTAQPEATIAGYQGMVLSAQGAVSGNLGSISGKIQELNGKTAALTVAKANLSQGMTPAEEADVAQARAGLKQARGAYALAIASLEKTIIRSPIAGVVDSLLIDAGDYISPGTPVASVSNASGIEIKTSVTETDAAFLHIGAPVLIDDNLFGLVSRVSPGIDPLTKKVEVRIAVDDSQRTLVNGRTVRLAIERTGSGDETQNAERSLPLSAIKLYADRSVVFTVDENNTLIEHKVELGPLLGDRVIVLSGVDDLSEIVRDARGLREGEEVSLAD